MKPSKSVKHFPILQNFSVILIHELNIVTVSPTYLDVFSNEDVDLDTVQEV